MADFTPPGGPPPPKVPAGWKAVWNDQYKEWFYVNLHTKESTWDKPTTPAPHGDDGAPSGPPPGYSSGPNDPVITGDTKRPLDSNDPYHSGNKPGGETDAQLAARLQAEENSKASTDRGAADDYYAQSQQYPQRPAGYDQQTSQQEGMGSRTIPLRHSKVTVGPPHKAMAMGNSLPMDHRLVSMEATAVLNLNASMVWEH
ncbi:hypothetical protein DV736_g1936, partial [Chaetothyriales sp. CBS 134916]